MRPAVHQAIHLPHPPEQPGIVNKRRTQAGNIVGKRNLLQRTHQPAINVHLNRKVEHKIRPVPAHHRPDKPQAAQLLHRARALAIQRQGNVLRPQLIHQPLAEIIRRRQANHPVTLLTQGLNRARAKVIQIPGGIRRKKNHRLQKRTRLLAQCSRYQGMAFAIPSKIRNSGAYPSLLAALPISAWECRTSPGRKSRYTGSLSYTTPFSSRAPFSAPNRSFSVVRSPTATLYTSLLAESSAVAASRLACTAFSIKQKSRLVSPSPLMNTSSPRTMAAVHFGITAA